MDHVDTYLMHHGVKGQQWGNKHGPPYPLDDNPSKQAYKKKKAQQASSDSRKEQKKIAKQERAEYKKKKLPRTSLGLALKNSTMSDAEFREASKKLKRDREVYDGIISDMYRLERAVNLPGMFLNDGVKAIKNIDYIYGLITGSSMTEARRMLARSNSISNRMVGKKNTRIAKNNTGLYYGVGSYLSGDSPRAGGSAAYKNFLDNRLSTKMGDAVPMNMISTSEYDRLMSQFKHSDMSDSNYLQHYGVLGMKWGVRNAKPTSGKHPHLKRLAIGAGIGVGLLGVTIASAAIEAKKQKKREQKLRNLYFTSDGKMTPEGKRVYDNYSKINKSEKNAHKELMKLKNEVNKQWKIKNKTSEPLFGKSMNADDYWEILDSAKEYGISTKSYNKAVEECETAQKNFFGNGKRDFLTYDRVFKHSDLTIPSIAHSDTEDINNFLCHYGVLGMKWGRRKARPDVNSERREKLNKVKAKVKENLKPWQISGSYKQNTYNHNQSPYQETTKVTASGGININPLSAEKTNEYAQKIYELKQRIPRLYHSDFDDNYLCHYGRKGMKWGQHIFGEDPNEKKLLSSPKINKTKLLTSTSGFIEGEIYDSAGNKKETEFDVHKEITFPPLPKLTESEMTDLFKDVSKNFPKMDKKAKEEILYDIKNTWLKEPGYLEKDHPFRKMSDEDILKNISHYTSISYDMAIPNTKNKDLVMVWYTPKSDIVFPGAYTVEYLVDKDEKGNKVYKYDYLNWDD